MICLGSLQASQASIPNPKPGALAMQAGAISSHQELLEQSICLYHCSISSKKDLTTQTHPTVGNRRAGGVLDWGKPWAGGQGTPHGTPAVSTPRGAEVTSIVAGGTKNNLPPGLVTSPKATFLETPRVVTEFTIQDGKSKEEDHNGPVDTAQEIFSLGLWCPDKYEKQIVLKFMVFWQFDLASLS
ncbi:hypothetical protein HGM15179_010128 [Zosterops borbonicus]|uniref:Uncharacterized protein n=1 Tax=Zosterops borbonicus TaxID=364589 RepID=A0A8K1GFW7_9PASS|nr:hypothetical protein HGM15179_010128 [Zosterops borbonicus]